MHGDLSLGGPVWLFATVVILLTLVLALFVIADALRPRRRAALAERSAAGRRELLWPYVAVETFFLLALAMTQVLEGISLVSALPVIAAPFALAFGVAYLLRVVFPRPAAPSAEHGEQDR